MIALEEFCRFVCFRPGLAATVREWEACLGVEGWNALKHSLFTDDGLAAVCRAADGRTVRVVTLSGGRHALVCCDTGTVVENDLPELGLRSYRLDMRRFRAEMARALDVLADPLPVRDAARLVPLGNWTPVQGHDVAVTMMLPPSAAALCRELQSLARPFNSGAMVLLPHAVALDAALRADLKQQKVCVMPLCEVLELDEEVGLVAAPAWAMYRSTYCRRHLSDRMVPAQPAYQFVRRGMWVLRFAGKDTHLEGDLKGAAFIHHLIVHQHQRIHVVRLMTDVAGVHRTKLAAVAEGLETDSAMADDVADRQAVKECQARYDALVAEREHAEEDRISDIEKEIAEMAAYLSSALGLGKRPRKLGDEVAAARRRIARVITIAIEKISKNDLELATHLRNSIKTHIEMVYEPDREVDWVLT